MVKFGKIYSLMDKGVMKQTIRRLIILFLFIPCSQAAVLCDGPHDGKALTREAIIKLINEKQDKSQGINICGTHLSGVDLSGLDLQNANLNGADLTSAKLDNVNLSRASLERTFFRWASLRKANLSNANLKGAKLQESNLSRANLHRANLELADLSGAQIQKADLSFTHAKYANFAFSDLSQSSLVSSYLYRGNFEEALLVKSNMRQAILINSSFNNADASYCNFTEANLENADFLNAILKGANFFKADMLRVTYQPKIGSLPDIVMLATSKNFRTMNFNPNIGTSALAELRTAYGDIGMRLMEREISAMLKIAEMKHNWDQGGFGYLEAALSYVFFYLTCDFGAAPARPIKIFLAAILFFAIPYFFALLMPSRHSNLYVTWKSGRFTAWDKVARQSKQKTLIHLLRHRRGHGVFCVIHELFRSVRIAFLFSLISSFQIGWGDFNLSTLISRMQAREYFLSSKGWVRFVAGFQSLTSAYLIILWALSYFGQPFQ